MQPQFSPCGQAVGLQRCQAKQENENKFSIVPLFCMNCVQLHSASDVYLKQSVLESLLLKFRMWMRLARPFGCHSDANCSFLRFDKAKQKECLRLTGD